VIDDFNPRLTNALVILSGGSLLAVCRNPARWTKQRLAVQCRFPGAHRIRRNEMPRSSRYFLVILALAAAAAQPNYAQDKTKEPKIVLDLEKPAPANDSKAKEPASANATTHVPIAQPFGKACSSVGAAKDGYRSLDQPYTIADLFGAPIEVITVRRLGPGPEKPDREELRKRITAVLNAQTTEVSRYQDWDEWVPQGLVVTIQFYDRTKSVLEESSGHVCFSDYAGTVWWLRIPAIAPKPQPQN
jgi:hypothetical protein